MKRLILLVFALQCATAFAQWEQMNGPYGGSVITTIISDPITGTLYAGGYYSGVFRSDDGGESWVDISNGLTELTIRSIVITPNGDLFTTGDNGIARLLAGEGAWEVLENELSALPVAALAANSQSQLFAAVFNKDGTEASGVYRSMDNGVSWSLILDAEMMLEEDITLAADATDKIYFGATAGAFRSDDNGVTWIDISPFNGYYNITSFAFSGGGVLFAGTTYMGGIFRSYDNGAAWELVHDQLDMAYILDIEVNDNNEIFAADGTEVLKSEDAGNTWNWISNIGVPLARVNDLLAVGQDTLFAAEYNLYRSVDNGISFSEASEGMTGTAVNSLAIGNDLRIYATTFYKLWVMDYDEEIWEDISDNFPVLYGIKDVKNYPQGLYVISDGALYMSVDNGTTWEMADMLGEAIPADSYGVNNQGYIYIASGDFSASGVYRSTDGGATFELLDLQISNATKMEINQNGTILIYEQFQGFHRSTDNGDTWEFTDFYNSVLSMETGDSGVFYAIGYGGVWRSEDDGLTWQDITPEEGGENIEYKAIHKHHNGDLFLSSQEAVYISTDDGLTWNDYYTASATPVGFISFASDPSLPWLFAGHSGRGLWKASTVTGTVTAEAGTNQLYPNPATHSITLQTDKYNKTTAPVLIYNSSGRLVKQLPVSSARMEIDISSLSTGIYYVVYNGKGKKFIKE